MALACAVPGCADVAQTKGMCWRHYGRWRRNGDPLASGQHGGRRDEQVQPTIAPNPAPLVALRSELQRWRSQGVAFDVAWRIARDRAPTDWQAILDEHESAWRSAYDRTDAHPTFGLDGPWDEPRQARRSAPPLILTGARHDAPSTLEPVEVPWCR